MIKFFRNIRFKLTAENKVGKYLLYAVGEILLVVIGILIALQVNNWNEGRKNELKETLLVKNIIEDLRLDAVHIDQSLDEVANQMQVIDQLIAKALDPKSELDYSAIGLVRYSSDFRPIAQRNHADAVSDLEDENTRKLIQNYFLKEDQVMDIFIEYVDIVHNKIRPYLSEAGMHNLQSLLEEETNLSAPVLLHPSVLDEQLGNVSFQQLLFERRLKTGSFEALLKEIRTDNDRLIDALTLNTD